MSDSYKHLSVGDMIRCDTCPYCEDRYPGQLDFFGNPFQVCTLTGNTVYNAPRRERRHSGNGWINYDKASTCGLFESVEAVLNRMTEPERKRYFERMKGGEHDE